MSIRLKLREWQIVLLRWQLAYKEIVPAHASLIRKWTSTGFGPEAYAEQQWRRIRRERKILGRRFAYLKRRHYIECVEEGKRLLYKLTSRGEYELLRLRFMLHMREQRQKKWSKKFYLVMFDIPEAKKMYRDFLRKLLRKNGFYMIQRSVWMTRYSPHPAITMLIRYLGLGRYFELMEIECKGCNSRLQRRIH